MPTETKTQFTPTLSEIYYKKFFDENGKAISEEFNKTPADEKEIWERAVKLLHTCKAITRRQTRTKMLAKFQIDELEKTVADEVKDIDTQCKLELDKYERSLRRIEQELEYLFINVEQDELKLPGIGTFKEYVVQRKTKDQEAVKQLKFKEA